MRYTKRIMMTTALGILATGANLAQAQDENAVLGAYQTYAGARMAAVEAQNSGGDATAAIDAANTAQGQVSAACEAAGTPDLATCLDQYVPADSRLPDDTSPLVAQSAPAQEPAAEEPAAPVVEEPVTQEPAAPEEPAVEEPAEPVVEAPAEPEPAAEPAAPEEPVTEEAPTPEPAPETAPEPEAQTEPEAAPEPETRPAAEPEMSTEVEPSDPATPAVTTAYTDYLAARDEALMLDPSQEEYATAYARTDEALATLATICNDAGVSEVSACLDEFVGAENRVQGDLDPLPTPETAAAEPQAAPEAETGTPEEEPETTADGEAREVIDPADTEGETISEEEVAPLFDSAKDEDTEAASAEASDEAPAAATAQESQPATAAATTAEPEAAPTSDEDAQAETARVEVQSITEEQGEVITESEAPQARIQSAPSSARVVEREDGGNTNDFRIVFEFGDRLMVRNDDRERMRYDQSDRRVERLRFGRTRETVTRRNGTQVITVYNRNGDILRRSLIEPDGSEYQLVYTPEDREEDLLEWRDPGRDLPPLRLNIPARDYVLDAARADEEQVYEFLAEPPIERVQRLYSVDEVKRSARLRDMVRRLEVGGLTFDSGAATISPDQVQALTKVANAMRDLLDRNPAETFLIEGHTDAVGSEISNLDLSDRRAETVAVVLTQVFGIPPENLATQGYGERFLKINTQAAERLNRRVTIKRITPLVSPSVARN